MRNEDIATIKFFIFIAVMFISVIGALWVSKKYFEKSIYETFKTVGIKALAIIAIFNIFASSNNELHDDSSDSKQKD